MSQEVIQQQVNDILVGFSKKNVAPAVAVNVLVGTLSVIMANLITDKNMIKSNCNEVSTALRKNIKQIKNGH